MTRRRISWSTFEDISLPQIYLRILMVIIIIVILIIIIIVAVLLLILCVDL